MRIIVPVDIDTQRVSEEINDNAAEKVETADSVERWITDNKGALSQMLTDAIVEAISEAYT